MGTTKLICNNFSGINRISSVFSAERITATDMQNVELFSTEANCGNGIRTASGNVAVCDLFEEGERVIGIFESVQKSVTHFFVYTEDDTEGKIYEFFPENGSLAEKVSGLSVTGKACATDVSQGWSDLWVFSNSEDMLSIELGKVDEDNEPDEITVMTPVDMDGRSVKGLGLVVFAGRLWVFNKQVLWYSVQEDIYDFATSDPEVATSSGYIEFVKNITAIYPYLGLLAVFHSNSSCMIALDEENQSFYKTFDSPGGCAGYDSLVFHGVNLVFYDATKQGVFSFRQVINGDKTLGENIALNIQKELLSIPTDKSDKIRALSVVTSDRNEVWFLIPSESENYSTIMIYDYLRNCWVKRKSQKLNCFQVINGKLYSAGKKIYEEYKSDKFDGEFIDAFYECAPLNLGEENTVKVLSYPPKITINMDYTNNFYVGYVRDYDSLTQKNRRIVSKTLNNVLYFDKGRWDVNVYPYEKNNVIKRLPSAYFKTLKISFYTSTENQNFCINNIEFSKIAVHK